MTNELQKVLLSYCPYVINKEYLCFATLIITQKPSLIIF